FLEPTLLDQFVPDGLRETVRRGDGHNVRPFPAAERAAGNGRLRVEAGQLQAPLERLEGSLEILGAGRAARGFIRHDLLLTCCKVYRSRNITPARGACRAASSRARAPAPRGSAAGPPRP